MRQLVFSSMGGSTIPLYISFAFLHLGIHVFLLSQEGPALDTIEGTGLERKVFLWIIPCPSLLGHCNNLIFDYFQVTVPLLSLRAVLHILCITTDVALPMAGPVVILTLTCT